jgi:uncharacterized membrane protein (UPF0127 family)
MAKLKVQIADNSVTLAQGLMGIKQMPSDEGMLFVFPDMTDATFWGKNTYIPLDLAFVKDNEIIDIQSIVPMSTRPVRTSQFCNKAIEANAGYFKKNKINPGDQFDLVDEDGHKVIVFRR